MSNAPKKIAFIQSGNKQVKVEVGSSIIIDHQKESIGNSITFDQVLMVLDEKKTEFGKPYLKNVSVIGEIEAHRKDKKVVGLKAKRRKGYKVHYGHRQPYTQVIIKKIITK